LDRHRDLVGQATLSGQAAKQPEREAMQQGAEVRREEPEALRLLAPVAEPVDQKEQPLEEKERVREREQAVAKLSEETWVLAKDRRRSDRDPVV
jgi:hypothetical protein